ncbi:nucleotide-sugar transporter-domain-containing protein [Glomus cerebriforme]|uniref:Nucleotide-sugar transporter-domain-containing protein n=1 Tax=Glomus cerebriforme TaxID=658196 RepID=A0A397T847_9GLOM|nr:nucleotide-sugar transporter-domain-containing protein [Glomus cerebriforme]
MSAGGTIFGIPLKYVSLITLCIQNSTLVIVMRYSRLDKENLYYTSTAVFLSELTKLLICLYMAGRNQIHETGRFNIPELYSQIFAPDSWKLMIPAALYTIQNNLQYVAVSMLDAATFQVTYQLKILTTALCSVIMLKTSLTGIKWFSLVLLTFGVALVQMPSGDSVESKEDDDATMEKIVGLGAVAVACVISGIAGVYFEMVLKGSKASVWIRNVQLSFFSLFPALIMGVWWKDGTGVWENGFFYNYNYIVLSAIACQAIGGIIVAMVVKYADNILKGFATSISIILSFLASVYLFEFIVTSTFLLGATLVLTATYMYSKPDPPKQESLSNNKEKDDGYGYDYAPANNVNGNGYTSVNGSEPQV